MATSNKPGLVFPGLFDIKDKVAVDRGIANGHSPNTSILESCIVIKLTTFKGNGISPQGVSILLIKLVSFLDVAELAHQTCSEQHCSWTGGGLG